MSTPSNAQRAIDIVKRYKAGGIDSLSDVSMRDIAISDFMRMYKDRGKIKELKISDSAKKQMHADVQKYTKFINATRFKDDKSLDKLDNAIKKINKVNTRYRSTFDSSKQVIGDVKARDDVLQLLKTIYKGGATASRTILADMILREGGWKDKNYHPRIREATQRGLWKKDPDERINTAKLKLLSIMGNEEMER